MKKEASRVMTPFSSRMKKTLRFLSATIGMFLACLPMFSQGNAGRILGTVTDQSRGVMAGAQVTIIDTQRGVSRMLTADGAGEI